MKNELTPQDVQRLVSRGVWFKLGREYARHTGETVWRQGRDWVANGSEVYYTLCAAIGSIESKHAEAA